MYAEELVVENVEEDGENVEEDGEIVGRADVDAVDVVRRNFGTSIEVEAMFARTHYFGCKKCCYRSSAIPMLVWRCSRM